MATLHKEPAATHKQAATTVHIRDVTENGDVIIHRTQELDYDITSGTTGKTVVIGVDGHITIREDGPQSAPTPHRQEFTEDGEVIIHRSRALTYHLERKGATPGHPTNVSGFSGTTIKVQANGGIIIGSK